MISKKAFIFIGRSGSGKGTQGALLQKYLNKIDSQSPVLYVQSGSELREFIKGQSITQRLALNIYDNGGLMPEFLAIHMWTNVIVNNFSGKEHLIIDGSPRKFHEAGVLHSIFGFYGIEMPFVIHLDIRKEESIKRLIARGRFDDSVKDIEERLSWYETHVVPTIEFYRNNPHYHFMQIDGEADPEEIHQKIVDKIKPLLIM